MDFFVDLLIGAIGAVAFIAISRAFGLFERAFFAGGLLVAAVAYVGFGMVARSASELTVELGGSALFAALGALGLVCSMWFHDKGSIDKSRRAFVKTAALGGAALASSVALGTRSAEARVGGKAAAGKPSTPQIKLAGYPLDRVQGLIDGRVQVEGCDIRFESAGIAKLNATAMGGSQGWEVQEIGLHPYMLAYANGSLRDYSLIPVFPLRTFRHKSIFVRSDRGIRKPEDLRGKKVGVSAYAQSSLVWIRGILEHEYGVKPEEMHWVVSSRASEGKVSKNESVRPKAVPIEDGPAGKDESELLVEGAIDAVFAAKEPQAFIDGNPIVRRLFPDSRATEQAYFEKTRIFPIMHAVAIRNDAIEKYPWLPKRTFEAYSQSKSLMYHDMRDIGWVLISLPWFAQELEETRTLMGDNFWPYGITPDNRKTLEALFQYSYEQGFSRRRLTVEELFHPSTLDLVEESIEQAKMKDAWLAQGNTYGDWTHTVHAPKGDVPTLVVQKEG